MPFLPTPFAFLTIKRLLSCKCQIKMTEQLAMGWVPQDLGVPFSGVGKANLLQWVLPALTSFLPHTVYFHTYGTSQNPHSMVEQ